MVADTPAHSQLPTEFGVVGVGPTWRGFLKDPLPALEGKNTKAVSSAIKFFHIPVVNCFVVPKAVSTFQREQKRKRH